MFAIQPRTGGIYDSTTAFKSEGTTSKASIIKVAPPGFEPRSAGPEPTMMDRYTRGLCFGRLDITSSTER